MNFPVLLILFGVVASRKVFAAEYSYKSQEKWVDISATCGGSFQSPIDIETDYLILSLYPQLFLNNHDSIPSNITITNNGHTVTVFLPGTWSVSGGPLVDIFNFVQVHFHWGSIDSQGSEHTIDGMRFPIELHFVHYNDKYESIDEALLEPDGIMVFGVFGELSENDNDVLSVITDNLSKVTVPTSSTQFSSGNSAFSLSQLLPTKLDEYYLYHGSLTTPNCNENVVWIVFDETIEISEDQLNALRSLKDNDGDFLEDNFRQQQGLSNRLVEKVSWDWFK